ncbi:dihydrofolate reductase [Candidatus Saccharibacteria bacterium]|nr:dihydrofolate reductase [Candidatus Saccharibacteria bacterium]
MFSIISAIAKNNAIGKDNDLVFHIKEDMKFFRETTRNHTVIMGKKTWESLPGKLKDRKNLVISHAEVEDADGTITDLDKYIEKNKETDEEIFVIGGGSIYKYMLPHSKYLYLTEVDAEPEADIYFPEFDRNSYRKKTLKTGTEGDLKFVINRYEHK